MLLLYLLPFLLFTLTAGDLTDIFQPEDKAGEIIFEFLREPDRWERMVEEEYRNRQGILDRGGWWRHASTVYKDGIKIMSWKSNNDFEAIKTKWDEDVMLGSMVGICDFLKGEIIPAGKDLYQFYYLVFKEGMCSMNKPGDCTVAGKHLTDEDLRKILFNLSPRLENFGKGAESVVYPDCLSIEQQIIDEIVQRPYQPE